MGGITSDRVMQKCSNFCHLVNIRAPYFSERGTYLAVFSVCACLFAVF